MKYYLIGCLLTVVLEEAVFFVAGYRKKDFLLLCVCTNVLTNLSLNLFLSKSGLYSLTWVWEALVWLGEYLIYGLYEGFDTRLLFVTCGANLFSFLSGLLIFPEVRELIF